MCVNPMSIKVNGIWQLVPCGKCVECKKDQQNDIAVMVTREAEKKGSLEFITLTYRNDTIPMYYNIIGTDQDTGEEEIYGEPTRCPDEAMEMEWRSNYFSAHTDCFVSDYYHTDEEDYDYIVTPSLCRKDVQDWIKRCRRAYEYKHKEKLDLTYCVAGEYGPNTARPHFHLCLFGISHEVAMEFCADWNKNKGFTTCSKIEPSLKEGYNSFEAVGKYIGKYIGKPAEIENKNVSEHRCEKPRRQSSIGFGLKGDEESLMRYHYCFDMVGEYDPDDLSTIAHLSTEELKQLMLEIIKRKKYYLNGKDYKLPRKLSRVLFYRQWTETEPDGTVKRKSRSTKVQRLVARFVRHYFNQNFNEQLAALKEEYGSEVPFSKIREIVHNENVDRQNRAQTTFKTMVEKTYKKSYF